VTEHYGGAGGSHGWWCQHRVRDGGAIEMREEGGISVIEEGGGRVRAAVSRCDKAASGV
jgi:hypothetical protein